MAKDVTFGTRSYGIGDLEDPRARASDGVSPATRPDRLETGERNPCSALLAQLSIDLGNLEFMTSQIVEGNEQDLDPATRQALVRIHEALARSALRSRNMLAFIQGDCDA